MSAFAAILGLASLCLSFTTARDSPLSTVHYALYVAVQLIFVHLTYLNHHTSRTSANLILVFWPAYVLASAVRIRTMILTGALSLDLSHSLPGRLLLAREALWLASAGFGMIEFVLELYSPEKRWKRIRWRAPWSSEGKIALEQDEEEEALDGVEDLNGGGGVSGKNEYGEVESPVSTANIFERLTFSWLTPLLSLGTRKFLGEEDMWSLPPNDSAEALSNRLQVAWDRQIDAVKRQKKSEPSLKIAIAQAYGFPYLIAGLLKALYDSLSFLQPQLLRLLLSYVSSYGTDSPLPPVAGYAISIAMFVSANVATAVLHQYFDRCFSTSKSCISLGHAKWFD